MTLRPGIEMKIAEEASSQRTVAPTEEHYTSSFEQKKSGDEGTINIISFFLGLDEYAFEVADAVEVLRPRQVTEVPRTPDWIKGILCVRGEMVPVVDLRMRLGLGASESRPSSRILVVAVEDTKAGLMVDRLSGVREVPQSLVGPPEEAGPNALFTKGVINTGERMIRLLDAGALVDAEGQ